MVRIVPHVLSVVAFMLVMYLLAGFSFVDERWWHWLLAAIAQIIVLESTKFALARTGGQP